MADSRDANIPSDSLFSVWDRKTGIVYSVYADGHIVGFGDDCCVFNRYPSYMHLAVQAVRDQMKELGND